MNKDNIQQLLERFLNAETTLEEEQTLYEYFQSEEVADDLKPYIEAFQGFAAVKGIDKSEPKVDADRTPAWVIALRTVSSIAAIFLVGLFFYLQTEPTSKPETAYHIQQPAPQAAHCTEGTPLELYTCYLELKREQTNTYNIIKHMIYENRH